jgi:hypothetical protein
MELAIDNSSLPVPSLSSIAYLIDRRPSGPGPVNALFLLM